MVHTPLKYVIATVCVDTRLWVPVPTFPTWRGTALSHVGHNASSDDNVCMMCVCVPRVSVDGDSDVDAVLLATGRAEPVHGSQQTTFFVGCFFFVGKSDKKQHV
jgi:hypothetical protein